MAAEMIMQDIQENPLGYIQLVRRSFRLMGASFFKILPIILLNATLFFSYMHYFSPVAYKISAIHWGLFEYVITLCWLFCCIILMKPLLLAVSYKMLNKPVGYLELIRKSLDNLDEYIFVVCVYFICVSLGLIVGVIPGIYFFVAGWFAIPLTALLYTDTMTVFRASMSMVTGNWFRCFAVFMTMILFIVMISYGLNQILLMTKFAGFVYNLISIVLYAIYLALTASAGVILLHELVIRHKSEF